MVVMAEWSKARVYDLSPNAGLPNVQVRLKKKFFSRLAPQGLIYARPRTQVRSG